MTQQNSQSSRPVACTLQPRQLADRCEAWRRLVRDWMVSREATPEGARVTMLGAPGVARAAREMAELEAECCSWMTITVEEAAVVNLSISSAAPGGPEAIRNMFGVG